MRQYDGVAVCPNCKEEFKVADSGRTRLTGSSFIPCGDYTPGTAYVDPDEVIYYNSPNSYRVKFKCSGCSWLVDYTHSENNEN